MGSNRPEPDGHLPALSEQRIVTVLDAHGMAYGTDDQGEIGSYQNGHLFYYVCCGEERRRLRARSRWHRTVARRHMNVLLELVNEWNAAGANPTAYVRCLDDQAAVYAEHSVDYGHGVSDEQIYLHLDGAVSGSMQLFRYLDEHLPDGIVRARTRAGIPNPRPELMSMAEARAAGS